MNIKLIFQIPEAVNVNLEEYSQGIGLSKAAVVKLAIAEYFAKIKPISGK